MAHIVIVDPDQSIRKLLGYIVSLLDWTSYLAASGREVWQLIEKTPPDLIIAEVDLNKMSGIELVWNMSQDRMLAHIPVILMGSPYQENDALATGCAAFIAKPFSVEKLLQLLPYLISERLPR
jgi:CheY-like chemotaxis protein